MKWDGTVKQEGGEARKRVTSKRKENREGDRISCALNLQCCSLPLDGGTVSQQCVCVCDEKEKGR